MTDSTYPADHITRDNVNALHEFIQARNEEAFTASGADPAVSDEWHDRLRRLTNSHKITAANMAADLLTLLDQAETGQLGFQMVLQQRWEFFASCGEQWEDHPGWKPAWRNPAHARLNASLGIPG